MLEIEYNGTNYVYIIETLANAFHAALHGNYFAVPSNYGSGYFYAENLPNGISVLIMDVFFKEDFIAYGFSNTSQYFILQFNESFLQKTDDKKQNQHAPQAEINQNMVLLTNSVMTTKFIAQRNTRTRSVKLLFGKEHLLQFLDNSSIDALMSSYFSEFLKNKKIEPIDAEYRLLMDELIKEKINHPLRLHFIQNRIMLLLERFIIKSLQKIQLQQSPLKLTDDEIIRLMKIEMLLVKDFSVSPPTIEMLSRLSAMSPTKLKKDFKSLYGLPIYEYYQKNRMLHAKHLLLQKKFTISEVGNKVGYTNLGHFAASFKKEFNMLPRQLSSDGKLFNPDEIFLNNTASA